jgi:hypothetical protein
MRTLFRTRRKGREHPLSGVIRDVAANLYGTTYYGEAYGFGTIFKIHIFPNGRAF